MLVHKKYLFQKMYRLSRNEAYLKQMATSFCHAFLNVNN